MTLPSIHSAELLPDEIDPRDFLRDVRLQELLLGMYPITVTDDDLEALTALREAALADGPEGPPPQQTDLAEAFRKVMREEEAARVAWPLVAIQPVIDDLAAELSSRSPDTLKKYRQAWGPFEARFRTFPSEWPEIRAWLDEYGASRWAGGTRARAQANLSTLYSHAAATRGRLKGQGMRQNGRPLLPYNPMAAVGIPEFTSARANPLTLADQAAIDALPLSLRDRSAWHLLHRHGWRPMSLPELSLDDVGDAVRRRDGYLYRTQKGRVGKNSTAPAPVLDDMLALLEELADQVVRRHKPPGTAPLFWGEGAKRWKVNGIYKCVVRWYRAAGVPLRTERPKGHIPYDLRDTFANEVAVNYGRGGREAAQRLMGHESGEAIEAYLVDQLPSDLRLYNPFGERSRGRGVLAQQAPGDGSRAGGVPYVEKGELDAGTGELTGGEGETRTPTPFGT